MIRALAATLALVFGVGPVLADSRLGGLNLVDAKGAPYAERSRGQVTLVGLWATWCPSCREDLPALIALGRELEREGGRLLLVSVDRVPEKAVRRLASIGYTGEAAYDPGAQSARRLGIQGIPTVLVLDRSGRERDRFVGAGAEIQARLKASARAVLASAGSPSSDSRPKTSQPVVSPAEDSHGD
jgi:thiol-disulfide isomerase/thioredoxin